MVKSGSILLNLLWLNPVLRYILNSLLLFLNRFFYSNLILSGSDTTLLNLNPGILFLNPEILNSNPVLQTSIRYYLTQIRQYLTQIRH